MFWPRRDTRVLDKRETPWRIKSSWMAPASRRLGNAAPFAFSINARRVSAPLVLFDLPSRMRFSSRRKRA